MTRSHRVTVRGKLLNLNSRDHHMPRAAAIKAWRQDAYWEAKAARLPHLERCSIVVTPFQARSVLADCGNHILSAKSVIDGLVDAGVLDSDDGEHVTSLTMLAPKRAESAVDRVEIELIEAAS